jgi:hypothetical protein
VDSVKLIGAWKIIKLINMVKVTLTIEAMTALFFSSSHLEYFL